MSTCRKVYIVQNKHNIYFSDQEFYKYHASAPMAAEHVSLQS
jgi:hypothetical protein